MQLIRWFWLQSTSRYDKKSSSTATKFEPVVLSEILSQSSSHLFSMSVIAWVSISSESKGISSFHLVSKAIHWPFVKSEVITMYPYSLHVHAGKCLATVLACFLCFFLAQSSMTFFELRVTITANLSPSSALISIIIFLNESFESGDSRLSMLLKLYISCVLMLFLIWLCFIATYFNQEAILASLRQVNIGMKRSYMP